SFSVGDMLEFGRRTNSRWDDDLASTRIERARIDLAQRVGSLSGGQRAQVGLTLALAKRPRLLLLDEPLASLDPLARREFLQSLMAEVAEGELTVVLSSHLITDLERVCDHLIVLSASRTQVAGDIDALLTWRQHRLQLLYGAAVLATLTGFLLSTGFGIASAFRSSGLAQCLAVPGRDCEALRGVFNPQYSGLWFTIPLFLIVPAMVGVFW